MDLLLIRPEPTPLWQTMIFAGIVSLLVFGLVVAFLYVFIKYNIDKLNIRRDTWADTGSALGLTAGASPGLTISSLSGKRGDHSVTVEPFHIQTGKYSSIACAAVEVPLLTQFSFSFEISKPEMFYQKVAGYFDTSEVEIGFDAFDKAFRVNCSHSISLIELLTLEMLDGESPTLLTDLLLANKKYRRIQITDRSVCLGVRAEVDDIPAVEETINKTIYLADRLAEANRRIA